MARERHAAALAAIEEETGWTVSLNTDPHLASLEQLTLELLGDRAPLARRPSIVTGERVVRVVSVGEPPAGAWLDEVRARLREQTGFELELRAGAAGTPRSRSTYDDTGRMELNLALAEVERAFAACDHRPYKKSKKAGPDGEWIELAFISPEVGARYEALIDEVAYRTSWSIRVAGSVDQQGVLTVVRELLPPAWQLRKNPGLDVAGRRVKLRFAAAPAQPEIDAVAVELERRTGFRIG